MNSRLSLFRAVHLQGYLAVMRDIGAPVDRELANSRLPPNIEEEPNLYLSNNIATEWISKCGRDIEPLELGFLAAQHATIASLKTSHAAMIIAAQTGWRRLETLLKIAHLEDSGFRSGTQREKQHIRVFCDTASLGRHPFICFSEWLNLQAIVSIMRSVVGLDWYPPEMSFISRFPVPTAVQAAFPDTHILINQLRTSILIPEADLAHSVCGATTLPCKPIRILLEDKLNGLLAEWTFTTLLRSAIQPYLNGGHPDLELITEITGLSKRTIQRRLHQDGSSYSEILKDARFELARSLLEDPEIKIIDIAMTSGYESPQHFSRAFRSFTGMTPTAYRNIKVG